MKQLWVSLFFIKLVHAPEFVTTSKAKTVFPVSLWQGHGGKFTMKIAHQTTHSSDIYAPGSFLCCGAGRARASWAFFRLWGGANKTTKGRMSGPGHRPVQGGCPRHQCVQFQFSTPCLHLLALLQRNAIRERDIECFISVYFNKFSN